MATRRVIKHYKCLFIYTLYNLGMHAYGIGAPVGGNILDCFFIQTSCLATGHAFADVALPDEHTHGP